jgi:hypothetical protein
MATIQLLCSEKFIKDNSSISDNVAGKYILTAMRDAQEIRLKGILGECLLASLKEMKADGKFNEPVPVEAAPYKDLVDRCQFFLLHATEVELLFRVSYKVGNFGVSKSTDENLQVATSAEIERQQVFYQSKADAEAYYNKTIAASLSPMIVQEDMIEKWDGKMPQIVSGNGMIMDVSKIMNK